MKLSIILIFINIIFPCLCLSDTVTALITEDNKYDKVHLYDTSSVYAASIKSIEWLADTTKQLKNILVFTYDSTVINAFPVINYFNKNDSLADVLLNITYQFNDTTYSKSILFFGCDSLAKIDTINIGLFHIYDEIQKAIHYDMKDLDAFSEDSAYSFEDFDVNVKSKINELTKDTIIPNIEFSITPNPAHSYINIKVSGCDNSNYFIQAYNSIGQNVFKSEIFKGANYFSNQSLSKMLNGAYTFILFKDAVPIISKNIIINK